MIYLNLSYFNTIKGPQVLCTFPEGLDKNKAHDIANLLNISELIKQKFFVYDIADFKTINHYFELDSEWARGKKEMLILSIIAVDEEIDLNKEVEGYLEKLAEKISKIDNAYMGFYTYDWGKAEEYDEVDENNDKIVEIVENSVDKAIKIVEESKKASQKGIRSIEPKDLGTYIMDASFFENIYKIERKKEVFEYLNKVIMDGIRIYINEEILADITLPEDIMNIFLPQTTIYHVPGGLIKKFIKEKIDTRFIKDPSTISLMVLADMLYKNKENRPVTIVTTNFKLNRFIKSNDEILLAKFLNFDQDLIFFFLKKLFYFKIEK
jgi:hypothetical protein